jgi:hypothetical protein
MKLTRGEWLLLFTSANLMFVTLDVWIAHSYNAFGEWMEYVPVFVCPAVGAACAAAFRFPRATAAAQIGLGLMIVMGAAGFYFHLESQFLTRPSLRSLVYSAPIAAPLVFCGLGLTGFVALAYDRRGGWMPLMIAGGFLGNFALTVFDHAQNGFFYALEWAAVLVAAFGAFYFALLFWRGRTSAADRKAILVYAALAVVTGLAGGVAHMIGVSHMPADTLVERLVFGPPLFAPFLFTDLAALAVIVYA